MRCRDKNWTAVSVAPEQHVGDLLGPSVSGATTRLWTSSSGHKCVAGRSEQGTLAHSQDLGSLNFGVVWLLGKASVLRLNPQAARWKTESALGGAQSSGILETVWFYNVTSGVLIALEDVAKFWRNRGRKALFQT